jgi:hypothetical protein
LLSKTYEVLKDRVDLLLEFVKEIEGMRKLPKIDIDKLMEIAKKLRDLEVELLLGKIGLELTEHLLGVRIQNSIQPVVNNAPGLA